MAVLVVADHDNTHLRDTTTKTITAAQKLSGEIDVLVLGSGCRAAARRPPPSRACAARCSPTARTWTRSSPRPPPTS
jgi:electron transfer flavoprotein alpha subunit